jgi:hypothetical protein
VDRFEFSDGHSIILLSRGRLVNLGNATGHSSFVMSTSFTNQVLAQIALWEDDVNERVQVLPLELDEEVARLHLDHLDVKLTEMTDEQSDYISTPKNGPFKPDGYRYYIGISHNSIFNYVNKKRVVSTLFLYLLIFSLGCDFESPQKWETPSWYLPLTIPLINKVYSFEGIVDSSIIFADSLTNVTQIVFGDSLPANGIPDETFNIDMSAAGLGAPDIGMADIAIEVAGDIDIEIPTIEAPNPAFALLTTQGSCFPQSKVGDLQSALDTIEPGELNMPISFETNESISIKEVIVNEGKWRMAVTNDWAVPILFSFKLVNGETVDSVLYNPVFSKIPPYTTPLPNEEPITTSNTTILDVTDKFNYSIIISILNEDTNCTGYECSLTICIFI